VSDQRAWLGVAARGAGYALLFLMMVFPMVIELLPLKAGLFAVLLGAVAVHVLRTGRLQLHPAVLGWSLGLAAMSAAFVAYGFAAGAPGAADQGQVYVIFPLVYTVLVAGATGERALRGIHWTVIVGVLAAGVYALLYVLAQLGVLPQAAFIATLSQEAAIGFNRGYVEFNLYFLNSLPFMIPYVLAALFAPVGPTRERPLGRTVVWAAAGVGIAVATLSGRRALWVVIAIAPLFLALFYLALGGTTPALRRAVARALLGSLAAVVAVGLVLRVLYQFDIASILSALGRGFDYPRREQLAALLDGWLTQPWLGHGLGSYTPVSVRSDTMPWAYELYFAGLLYQVGVVGMAAYAAGIAWIVWAGVRVLRRGGTDVAHMYPALVGLSCFLIATGTNPYLARFDGLWTVFVPIAAVNAAILRPSQPAPA
jgi:hypothetical protein